MEWGAGVKKRGLAEGPGPTHVPQNGIMAFSDFLRPPTSCKMLKAYKRILTPNSPETLNTIGEVASIHSHELT